MSVSRVDFELNLASGRGAPTEPFKANRRTPNRPTLVAAGKSVALDAPYRRPRFRFPALSQAPRPSWVAFASAIATVGVIVWLVMSQRLPDIDPGEVIAANLSSAERALNEGLYVEPPLRSAVHYYSTVLALDPDNVDAVRGMDLIAERYIDSAKTLIQNARFADAVIALEHVRRVRPEHRRLALLEAELSKEVERHAWLEMNAPPIDKPNALAAATPPEPAAPTSKPNTAATAEQVTNESFAAQHGATPEATRDEITSAVRSSIAEAPPVIEKPALAALLIDPSDLAVSRGGAGVEGVGDTPLTQSKVPAGRGMESGRIAAAGPEPITAPEPKLVKYVEPKYPRAALLRGEEGWIDVSLSVNPAGQVIDPRIEDGEQLKLFDRAALNAVRQWTYEPLATTDPSKRIHVRLKFELED